MEFNVPLAPAEQAEAILQELSHFTPLVQIRGLDVFTLRADEVPVVMNDIGRIREQVFRSAGAGRNMERDTDDLDFGENSYQQLVVWDPKRLQIVALYRFKLGSEAVDDHTALRTSQLFDYSHAFCKDVLPNGVELGRSVVNQNAPAARFGFFALWAGLNALLTVHPHIRYFFGNVSLYKTLGREALTTIIGFCQELYAPPEPMLVAKEGLAFPRQNAMIVDEKMVNLQPRERIYALQKTLRDQSLTVPKILQSYLSLGNHIWFDDAALDNDFGDAYELSIVVPVAAIDPTLREKLTP